MYYENTKLPAFTDDGEEKDENNEEDGVGWCLRRTFGLCDECEMYCNMRWEINIVCLK